MLRAYDEAMRDFLTVKLRGQVVPMVGPSSSLRAFASVQETLGLSDDPRVKKDPRFIPLPYIAWVRKDAAYAQHRFSRPDIRKLTYSDDGNRTTIARRPNPWDIPYEVEVWAETETDLVYIMEAYLRKWRGPKAYIQVNHGEPFGMYRIAIDTPRVTDLSDLEDDDSDRSLLVKLDLVVEGFMSFPATWVPTVREVNVDLIDNSTSLPQPTLLDNIQIKDGEENQ